MDFSLEQCIVPKGRKIPYPLENDGGDDHADWRDVYVPMSEGGEHLRQYLRSLIGFPIMEDGPAVAGEQVG
jgi:hypothetical protein